MTFKEILSAIVVASVLLCSQANAGIIYSGVRNIEVTIAPGEPGTIFTLDVAGDSDGTWDNLQFELFTFGPGSTLGASTSWVGSPGVLGYESNFPYVENYNFGDMPANLYGSASIMLWYLSEGYYDVGAFRDVRGYASMMIGDFEGPKVFGWIQLEVQNYYNSDGLGQRLTIIDWAFEDTGAFITIGEGQQSIPVPAPNAFVLMLLALAVVGFTIKRKNASGVLVT